MNVKKMDHIGLDETGRQYHYLLEDDRITQRFGGHCMSKKLDATISYILHNLLSGPYQHGGTLTLTTGNLIGRRFQPGRETSGLGRCSW